MTRRRICLFGGSFDPPHVCHVLATSWALSTLAVDELWWMPTFSHAFGKKMRPFEDRMAMCRAAISCFGDKVSVTAIEREIGGESRTLHTVETLLARHPDLDISLLFGADIIAETHRWEGWPRLVEMAEVHVIGRGVHPVSSDSDFSIVLPDVSSTRLREAFARGDLDFVQPRVPRAVVDLIRENGWYADA